MDSARRSSSLVWRLLSQGWLKCAYAFADHTRNALILSVFAFKVCNYFQQPVACSPFTICRVMSCNAEAFCYMPCSALTSVRIILVYAVQGGLQAMTACSLASWLFATGSAQCTSIATGVLLQLLEWWYTSAEEKVGAQKALPPPPPPPLPQPAAEGLQLPDEPMTCPICSRCRTNPAMASVSGYVFCYPCIFGSIQQHGCCPVTLLPATVDQIRRLYQSA